MSTYHGGSRELQERFGSGPLADRLSEKLSRDTFTDDDKAFVESASFFFLATADAEGRPDCSFKGGPVGFVKIHTPRLLLFPDYDGNGMFRSLGNIRRNPHIGMLFIAMGEKPKRLRVNGRAVLDFDHSTIGEMPGAQLVVQVVPELIFPNCPRYIPNLGTGASSPYEPRAGVAPLEPAWKGFDMFKDVVPPRAR